MGYSGRPAFASREPASGERRRGNETLKSQQAPVAKREPAEKPKAL